MYILIEKQYENLKQKYFVNNTQRLLELRYVLTALLSKSNALFFWAKLRITSKEGGQGPNSKDG